MGGVAASESTRTSSAATSTAPVGSASFTVPSRRRATSPSTASTHSERTVEATVCGPGGVRGVTDDLDQPALVAQVQEDQAAVIAPTVDPAREEHALAPRAPGEAPRSDGSSARQPPSAGAECRTSPSTRARSRWYAVAMTAGSRPATPLPEPAPEPEALGLYVHVPFCTSRCGYCDFNAYAGVDHLVPEYVEALVSELGLWSAAARGQRVVSVFFGGGTPSLLPLGRDGAHRGGDRGGLRSGGRRRVGRSRRTRPSSRANTCAGSPTSASAVSRWGCSRCTRRSSPCSTGSTRRSGSSRPVADARAAGFSSLNLDLIFGLPEQPLARWQQSVERVLALGPDHLSCYALSVEPGDAASLPRGEGGGPGARSRRRRRAVRVGAARPARPGRIRPLRDLELGAAGERVPAQPRLLARRALPGGRRRGALLLPGAALRRCRRAEPLRSRACGKRWASAPAGAAPRSPTRVEATRRLSSRAGAARLPATRAGVARLSPARGATAGHRRARPRASPAPRSRLRAVRCGRRAGRVPRTLPRAPHGESRVKP